MLRISSSTVSQRTREVLLRCGFQTLDELDGIAPKDLMKELRVDATGAKTILEEVTNAKDYAQILQTATTPEASTAVPSSSSTTNAKQSNETSLAGNPIVNNSLGIVYGTAHDLLQAHKGAVITFCRPLDEILGGGISIGEVFEICGVPGVGKTQLCMQLAADTCIPNDMGGVDGTAIYIDTEGSFMIERYVEICDALARHLNIIAQRRNGQKGATADNETLQPPTLTEILGRLQIVRCTDVHEQIATIMNLGKFIENIQSASSKPVKLVILDSMAFHYRNNMQNMQLRTRQLARLSQNLHHIANAYNVAIVVTNHMTTRFNMDQSASNIKDAIHSNDTLDSKVGNRMSTVLVPALGETWSHACSNRLILYWQQGKRQAALVKSPSRPPASCSFSVTSQGIRRPSSSTQNG